MAYGNLSAKEGNLTKGTDGATIDGMGMERIRKLIESLRNHSYQPSPARRAYIPKSNGKRRPLGIPSVDDKLVQEVVRLINNFFGRLPDNRLLCLCKPLLIPAGVNQLLHFFRYHNLHVLCR